MRKRTRAGSPSSTSGSHRVAKRILFDATRLAMRGRSNSPTGIDRVVLAYARWLISRPDLEVIPVATWGGKLMPLRPGCLAGLAARAQAMSTESGVRDAKWAALRNALEMDSAPDLGLRPSEKPDKPDRKLADGLETVWLFMGGKLEPRPGDIYLNVSHSGLESPDLLAGLVDQGVAPVVMVHDLIPLTHPEFCGPNAADRHEGRVRGLLKYAALVLVNSSTTAEELGRYASQRSLRQPPVEVALLGTRGGLSGRTGGPDDAAALFHHGGHHRGPQEPRLPAHRLATAGGGNGSQGAAPGSGRPSRVGKRGGDRSSGPVLGGAQAGA